MPSHRVVGSMALGLRRKLKLRKEPPRAAVSFALFYSGIWEPPNARAKLRASQIKASEASNPQIARQLQRSLDATAAYGLSSCGRTEPSGATSKSTKPGEALMRA